MLTHLGHSCVLIEEAGLRILIDPGNLTDNWHGLRDLDAVLVTHQHPDHLDPVELPKLLAANPNAICAVEASAGEKIGSVSNITKLNPGQTITIGELQIAVVGGQHAIIHQDIARIANIGLVISAPGHPTIFHPGDSLEVHPQGIDIVLIPIMAPWCATKEVIDFTRAVGAPQGMLIHDRLLTDLGYQMISGHIERLGGGTKLIKQRA